MLKFSKKIKNIFLNFMKEEKESFEIFNFSTWNLQKKWNYSTTMCPSWPYMSMVGNLWCNVGGTLHIREASCKCKKPRLFKEALFTNLKCPPKFLRMLWHPRDCHIIHIITSSFVFVLEFYQHFQIHVVYDYLTLRSVSSLNNPQI